MTAGTTVHGITIFLISSASGIFISLHVHPKVIKTAINFLNDAYFEYNPITF
jgi:ABC-type uncharacterized transport system permease subunit